MPNENVAHAFSVIDPDHPDNYFNHNDANGSYTYRTRRRSKKLNFTLGWELEANHTPSRIPKGVNHISDGSVNGDGAEFVVLPAITKSPKYVLGMLKELVHSPHLNTDDSCGFHVHVSASNLTIKHMRDWAIATEHLALMVEEKAFKAVPKSRQGNSYCRRIQPTTHGTAFYSHKYDNTRRYHWLNTVEMFRPGGIRTIEVRLLGNTHRWKYVLTWSVFCMELARRGWELSLNPFDINLHTNALNQMLDLIEKEIKPIDKRNEPIPQWVYNALKTFDIEPNAWDRPLAKLAEHESDVSGLPKKYYSDNQVTEPNDDSDDDEDSNSCACGCGESDRCDYQIHDDGDCDSAYCLRCHENGDCTGRASCDNCISDAHSNNQNCGRETCRTCERRQAIRSSNVTIHEGTTPPDNRILNGVRTGRVVLDEAGTNANFYGTSIVSSIMENNRMWMTSVIAPIHHIDTRSNEEIARYMLSSDEAILSAEREMNREDR